MQELRERLAAFVPKALREAKRKSKWIEPNEAYETATIELLDRLFADDSVFVQRLRPILADLSRRGMLISLARTVLKCTLPGVPDFYQGTGLWDFSLVDPDNRRPVDYAEREDILADDAPLATLLRTWQDGAIKLRLAADLLRDRRENALFYARSDYAPLTVTGGKWSKLVAFVRRFGSERLVVVVPRLSGSGSGVSVMPVGQAFWGATTIDLPAGRWRDVVEGRTIESSGSVPAGTLLESLPFAVMRMTA
jgi:(1->4)-alpha-D-glucan 1-alpha-D-glucosylmutase